MKKFNRSILFIALVLLGQNSFATVHSILVGQSGLTFSPSSITTVLVGDTIRWNWVSGSHTSTSLTIPSGASGWNVGIASSSSNFDYKVTTAGTYNYQCTYHSGSGMVGSFVVSTTTGVETAASIYASLVLSPNPTSENIQLKFNADHSSPLSILIFDASGNEKIKKTTAMQSGNNSISIDVSALSKGIYFLNVLENNIGIVVREFIKE
ncbi:MAG TPA: T9SS type A sorting domain-containing protein [Cytophagaceae bacterium]|jgi:plastocyanin|nr:T9SS type A sorting domain-containing protein [Cytophagaceae bacterium]